MTNIEMRFFQMACDFFANSTNHKEKEIDWEQRRYEIAKCALNALLSDKDLNPHPDCMANKAVDYADALIEQLKKKK